ncbi:MAG: oligopeptide:H+ symporter [Lactobacillus sp.]|jgi:POT family proton-dependent oligopeptide transporter|nr:oligopeptide:H+ symporter [Lactobacillus sp.]MCI2032662.1 oligopeptide:H+ symporter [Lactobacillus sp.]
MTKDIDKAFFGQPRGLATLFFTEMWERLSYYGMRAILLFYMYYAVSKGGLGFDQPTAASIMSIYGSMVYMAGVVGGWLSDRIWGSRLTVFIGGVLIMCGHIVLAMPFGATALFISIALIVSGTGLLKPNVSEMVGVLYSDTDRRRDAGFSLFVFGIQVGAAVAPIAVPMIADAFGHNGHMNFHAGFSLAAIGMFFGLLQYALDGKKYLSTDSLAPRDPIAPKDARKVTLGATAIIATLAVILVIMAVLGKLNITNVILLITVIAVILPIVYFVMMLTSDKVTKTERSHVLAYIPLFLAAVIFWAIEESGSVILAMFAEQRTILHLGAWHFQASNFQTLNPLFMMIFTPFFVRLWSNWKNQPTETGKFAGGLLFAGVSYLFMTLPGLLYGTSGRVSPLWLVGSWFFVEIGEMLISPIGLSITTKLAPKAFSGQMMSMWFMANATAQAINSQIVKLYTPGTEVVYFAAVGIVSVVLGFVLMAFIKPITRLTKASA